MRQINLAFYIFHPIKRQLNWRDIKREDINPPPATWTYQNVHPPEIVARGSEAQLPVGQNRVKAGENYSYFWILWPRICKSSLYSQ